MLRQCRTDGMYNLNCIKPAYNILNILLLWYFFVKLTALIISESADYFPHELLTYLIYLFSLDLMNLQIIVKK